MKALRAIHVLLGIAVIPSLISVAWLWVRSSFQAAERVRIGAVQTMLQEKLETYHELHGQYPHSLQVLALVNSQQEIRMQSDVRKMSYRSTPIGYTISYEGRFGYRCLVCIHVGEKF